MVYIYVLELVEGKYYIGKTNNPGFRIEQHFLSGGSSWTKKYNPIKLYNYGTKEVSVIIIQTN
jgi:predicted GIY-YIG superfamily endonuclease